MNRRRALIPYCVVTICASTVGCAESPHGVVERFIDSYNSKDVNSCISCLDPAIEKAYLASSRITSALIHVEIADIFDLLPVVVPAIKAHTGDASDIRMKGRHLETTVDGEHAIAVFEMTMIVTDIAGRVTSETEMIEFPLQRFDGEWRITLLK